MRELAGQVGIVLEDLIEAGNKSSNIFRALTYYLHCARQSHMATMMICEYPVLHRHIAHRGTWIELRDR